MNSRFLACAALAALSLTFSGCAKKVVAKAPSTPAPERVTPAVATAPAPARNYSQPERVASTPQAPRTPDAATRARIQDLLNRIRRCPQI